MGFALDPHQEGEISTLLEAWSNGDQVALEQLTPIVYGELRRLARHYLRSERAHITLQTTALVNEAYLKLVDFKSMRPAPQFETRRRFAAHIDRRDQCARARAFN
jgi:hypothetical protein